jgi:hypothetical protein
MKNSRSQGTMRAVIAGARTGEPVVEVKSYALAGAGMARVLVEVTHTEESRKDPSVIASAIRARLDNKMEAVAGSFTTVEKGSFVERITGIVSTIRKAIPVTEENMKGFRATAANMFMDEEKEMWALHKTQAGQILVQTTGIGDDMSLVNLLDSCSSAGFRNSPDYGRLSAMASATATQVQGGDFVSYVNFDNSIGLGFVVATAADTDDILVLPHGAEEAEAIKRAAVTQIHAQDEFPAHELTSEEQVEQVVASARGVSVEDLLSFYKKVFARNAKFYDLFAARVRSHQFM